MEKQSITDLSYLREMAMGDEDIVIETTEVFLEDTPDALEKMKAYYANEQWDELGKLAHKIKPNLSYMGMERARELIIDIEEQAKGKNISDDLRDKISEFEDLCRQAFGELTAKVKKLKS